LKPEPKETVWKEEIQRIFASQLLAVLASAGEHGYPYTSLVAFCATDDLRYLLFATDRFTRKYRNMEENPHVSLLIDNRNNSPSDLQNAAAVTAVGKAFRVMAGERAVFREIFLSKVPDLKNFLGEPSTALMKVETEYYYLVSRFQKVREISMKAGK
jgi:nitroimidazol reductase NimA-like FMN-containing flavoprotein (pyridoxamine 5'-phosphate oxidase superfamily)